MAEEIVIVSSARTAMGGLMGSYKDLTAAQLGSTAIKAAVERAGLQPNDIEASIQGCVLTGGQGQAPARQATLGAGLLNTTDATTINKMCGSGMKAIMLAHDLLLAGSNNVIVAGGFESMSNAPYLVNKGRSGYRLGHGQLYDSMFLDGLEDAYDKGKLMGVFADATAKKYGFTREQQDEFAITSLQRAQLAIKNGSFAAEIAAVTISDPRKGDTVINVDEQPGNAKIEKIPTLKPAFAKDGTVTAANSSSISDGAAAVVLMRRSEAQKRGLKPLAVIRSHATNSHEPAWFTTAPIGAINKALAKANWRLDEVDLFEINEAFAVVTMAAMHDLKLAHDKVNVYGGACALGHPIGASGARIIVTLLNALRNHGKKRGLASLCIGGGEAVAVTVELI